MRTWSSAPVRGFMGFKTLQAVLEAGKTAVDIAFFPEDPFALDKLAKAKGLMAIVDCGVAPGMSSILAAHAVKKLDKTRNIKIYVDGRPATSRTARWSPGRPSPTLSS